MRNVPNVAIRVSIDGIGNVHDRIRGIPGNYDRCLEVIRYCKGIGIKDLGIGTTVVKMNESVFSHVKDIAESLGVDFTCTVAHSSPIYFGDVGDFSPDPEEIILQLRILQKKYLRSSKPKDWFRGYFTEGVIKYVEGRPKRIKCGAGRIFVFIKANGDIYPCNMLNKKLGNFMENDFERALRNSKEMGTHVRACTKRCWMICTVAPMMKRNPLVPALWVLKNKLADLV
jgi:MoaA/NifB/PqqE/SkfB family radical SAM enzyme